jgi:hypothetical protein
LTICRTRNPARRRIVKEKAAWLECENASAPRRIVAGVRRKRRASGDPRKYKRRMLLAGYWGTEDGRWKCG